MINDSLQLAITNAITVDDDSVWELTINVIVTSQGRWERKSCKKAKEELDNFLRYLLDSSSGMSPRFQLAG